MKYLNLSLALIAIGISIHSTYRVNQVEKELRIQKIFTRLDERIGRDRTRRVKELEAKIRELVTITNSHTINFQKIGKVWNGMVLDYLIRDLIQKMPEPERGPAGEGSEVQG